MSRVLYLEPIGGIAGDMFMAAAIDLGVPADAIQSALAGLGLSGWRLRVSRAVRHGIEGAHVDVEVDAARVEGHPRGLWEILPMIDGCASLSEAARERARRIFRILGEAEAKVHGVPLEEVHFHEVGAVDSIVDVCAAAAVVDLLGAPRILSAPPPLGSGTVQTEHGPLPIPGPATLEILRGVPVRFEGKGELTTPTGAAILKALAEIGSPPPMRVERIGYGVGTMERDERANVLRACIGETVGDAEGLETVWTLEANLDDCTPQLLAALVEQALEAGALDAWIAPVVMKKGRPGHVVSLLAPGQLRDRLADLLLRESTTLGVRWSKSERIALARRVDEVQTRYGKIRIKVGLRDGQPLNAQPEFEDCRRAAREHAVPIKDVLAEAIAAWRGR